MQSPDGNQLWCPSQSLWSLISEHVAESELAKIHTALGSSLVSMYTEVHFEAEMWHKLWQESQQGSKSSRAGTPLPRQQCSPLPDPPAVKELVRAEVKMLLQTLLERASRGGSNGEELVFRYKPETVDYALSHLDSRFRSCTAADDSRAGSRCSLHSNAEGEVEQMRDKLNLTGIGEVVDRLKSVLIEECEALKKLINDLKENLKQNRRCAKPEPSLAELRELRGAIQTDLKLYPPSFPDAAPASSAPHLKGLKHRPSLSAGRRLSEGTLQAPSAASILRPHPPPPPLCPTKPRPPICPPSSSRLMNSCSPSLTHGPLRSTSALGGPRKTPMCNRITSPGQANSHFSTPLAGPTRVEIMGKSTHHSDRSPEPDRAGLHQSTPTSRPSFQIKTPGFSSAGENRLSSHSSPGRKCDLSPQTGRKGRLKSIDTISAARSPHFGAASYSSNGTERSVATTGKLKAQHRTCGSGSVSTINNGIQESTSESLHCFAGRKKSDSGVDGNRNGPLGKDVPQQQNLVATV